MSVYSFLEWNLIINQRERVLGQHKLRFRSDWYQYCLLTDENEETRRQKKKKRKRKDKFFVERSSRERLRTVENWPLPKEERRVSWLGSQQATACWEKNTRKPWGWWGPGTEQFLFFPTPDPDEVSGLFGRLCFFPQRHHDV